MKHQARSLQEPATDLAFFFFFCFVFLGGGGGGSLSGVLTPKPQSRKPCSPTLDDVLSFWFEKPCVTQKGSGRRIDAWMGASVGGWRDGCIGDGERINGQTDGWMDGRTERWMDGCMDGRVGRTGRWLNGWMHGWIDSLID